MIENIKEKNPWPRQNVALHFHSVLKSRDSHLLDDHFQISPRPADRVSIQIYITAITSTTNPIHTLFGFHKIVLFIFISEFTHDFIYSLTNLKAIH